MANPFACCQCKHEINERELPLKLKYVEEHLKVKEGLVRNLECIIDEQEGQIQDLQMRLEDQLGIKLIENPEKHVLKGISYLSLDFGALSEENLELKSALAASERQNRLLEMKLSNVTYSSTLPILVDSETQTEVEDEFYGLPTKKLSSRGSDLTLNDTGFESEDGSLDMMETLSTTHSVVPIDPVMEIKKVEPMPKMKNMLDLKKVVDMAKTLMAENVSLFLFLENRVTKTKNCCIAT